MKQRFLILISVILALCFLTGCIKSPAIPEKNIVSSASLPEFSGSAYIELNGNVPYFSLEDYPKESFEEYSELDYLNRCGVCIANIGPDLMPTEERGYIGSVKPSGWHSEKYDFVDGKYLYNRCHLIGYQLSGENANEKNLITGTRFLNVEGMLPFENMIADYVRESGNHVLLRVTPRFEGENLLASGVIMEAMSVEDEGEKICFNVYCYNAQKGVIIDYATGESYEEFKELAFPEKSENKETRNYVLNTKSRKIHYPSCSGARATAEKNKQLYSGSLKDLKHMGYLPCGSCKPQ
ncbi:MAG: DNA/RNA non-specific endonuclease [Clostridia bacterium]|nr:DNA/RNA non-specific endonuclease [Clostridia bacterium]